MPKNSKNKSRETEALKKIASMVNRSLDLNSILSSSLEEILESLGMAAGVFRLRATPEALPKTVCRGLSRNIISILEESCSDNDAQRPLPAMPSGDTLPWGSGPIVEALQKEGLQFSGPYAIRSGNRILGFLGLAGKDSKGVSVAQEEFLHALAEILGVAIVNAQLREQSNKLSEDLIALQEVNKIISQGFNLEDIIYRIVIEGKRLAKTSQCHLFKLDDKLQCLVGSASTQAENLDIRTVNIPFSEASTAVTALMDKRVIVVEDILRDAPRDSRTDGIAGLACRDFRSPSDQRARHRSAGMQRCFTRSKIYRRGNSSRRGSGASGCYRSRKRRTVPGHFAQPEGMGNNIRRDAGLRFGP